MREHVSSRKFRIGTFSLTDRPGVSHLYKERVELASPAC